MNRPASLPRQPARHVRAMAILLACTAASTACRHRAPDADPHADHRSTPSPDVRGSSVTPVESADRGIPPSAAGAMARLTSSPRHGEWVTIVPLPGDSLRMWVVYPERRSRAPVVVVIHEIFGLSPWIRTVADQLAADGFIAVAPDLLTMKHVVGAPENPSPDSARAAIRALVPADVQRNLDAAAHYGMSLPSALPRYGVVGFCWGGAASFAHAVHSPGLDAAVVYYGVSPPSADLSSVRAPVLGLYGEDDNRVVSTIAPADSTMRSLGKIYEHTVFPGAGHGFLRGQDEHDGANLAAARAAWPMTIAWLRKHLGD